ncbi:MAG: right-handed parallel beta-helix repeat-containing protein [Acidobacteriaceae bacterium]
MHYYGQKQVLCFLRNVARSGAAVACAGLSLSGSLALGQAKVIENQKTYIYVDALQGNDANPGTNRPVRSIGAAVRLANSYAAQNIGVRVRVEPGTYREQVSVGWARYNPTLTIEAAHPGTVTISGSDVYQNWQAAGKIYLHSFAGIGRYTPPSSWKLGSIHPIMFRKELVFVNGQPLTQVLGASQLQPGTFYANDSAQQLEVFPPDGIDMRTALVEVGVRPHTVVVQSRNNVVIRGLMLEHAVSVFDDNSLNVNGGSNILIDSVQANWNNFGGIHVGGTNNVTIQNSVANHNGGVGMNATRSRNGLFQFNETDYNNWRGAQAAFYDWGMGGFKFFTSHGNTVKNHFSYNNIGQGLWFDTDNRDITVDGATLSGNYVTNLQVELNYGPISIANSTLCYGQTGINLINSEQIAFNQNTLYGNGGNDRHMKPAFYLEGKQGGRHFNDYETGAYHNVISQKISLKGNAFIDVASNQEVFDTYLTGSDWAPFADSFQANGNRYFDPLNAKSFITPRGRLTLSGWQGLTGQELASEWKPAPIPSGCNAPIPSQGDFAVQVDAASYTATKGIATIKLHINNYNLRQPVSLSVAGLPSAVQAAFGTAGIPAATSIAGAQTSLTLSAKAHQGTVPVVIFARSGNLVHTVNVNVAFNN